MVTLVLTVVLAGAVSALIYANYRRDIRRARDRVAAGSQLAQTPFGPIEYAEIGDGPPILLVHGAGGGYDQGLDLGMPLARSGFRVIAMSRFGYLRTPLPADASAVTQADAHAALLDALKIDRAAVMGASAGGPSAMQFALRHADRCSALVLLVPAAYVPRAGNEASVRTPARTTFLFGTALKSDFLFWVALRYFRSTAIRSILGTPPAVVESASAAERARVDLVLQHILPVGARRLGLLNDAAVVSSLRRYDLERVSVRTLAISVPDDLYGTFDGARYTAEHIPQARFVAYPSGGHLCVGHQDEVAAEIIAFLK